eukprot:2339066-Pyramimonas_sp.AAC.1
MQGTNRGMRPWGCIMVASCITVCSSCRSPPLYAAYSPGIFPVPPPVLRRGATWQQKGDLVLVSGDAELAIHAPPAKGGGTLLVNNQRVESDTPLDDLIMYMLNK